MNVYASSEERLAGKTTLSSAIHRSLLTFGLVALTGCGGGGGGGAPNLSGGGAPPVPVARVEVRVFDVTQMPIKDATVTLTAGAFERQGVTDVNGFAEFSELPSDLANQAPTISVSAEGFEPDFRFASGSFADGFWEITLEGEGAWAIGRAIVLGTEMVERESDGSAITFSVDLAVIDEHSEVLQTLTSADFAVVEIDCGWGGPRDCASDAKGDATHNFTRVGDAQAFELLPPSTRHPYLVGVLVERSNGVRDWDQRVQGLKSFFSAIGGNDTASLMSVRTENESSTLTVISPFTNDGATHLEAIDDLKNSDENPPQLEGGLREAIQLAAMADAFGQPDVERHILVLASAGLSTSEVDSVSRFARESGVRISTITFYFQDSYGLTEAAARTGGFVAPIDDPRQLGMLFGAMDQSLAGTMPRYRMQFRLSGPEATFVPGGNVKVHLQIEVPTPIPNRGVFATMDVALPDTNQ